MALEYISPPDLPTPPTYSHVDVATGSTLVFVAGQEPKDEQGNLVGPARVPDRSRRDRPHLA